MGLHAFGGQRARISGRRWQDITACGELAAWVAVFLALKSWQHLDHFTWWGVIFHTTCLAQSLVGIDTFAYDVVVQCVVVVGVWYMSLCQCDLLIDATEEMGAAYYAAGNFFVHYMPSLSAVARATLLHTCRPSPLGTLLWLAYNAICIYEDHYPSTTYGCTVPHAIVLTAGVLTSIVAVLWLHS